MAEKGFGIKQLDILGATGIPLVESKAGLNIRVAGQGPGGIGHTVGIGTTGLTAWLETKANADPDNVTTLNCGIVTANKFYGTFEGTIGGDVAAITLNATTEDVFSVASNVLSADNPSGTNDKLIFWDESATKLTHLEVSTGLTLTDTTLTAEGTTYALKCTKDSDGGTTGTDADPYLFLDASSGTDDAVQIVGSGGLSVTRNDDGKLTITGAAAGGLTLDASVTDILDLTGSALSADDAGSDKIVFWDDDPGGGADGKLTYLSIGSGLTLSGTELTADISGGGGVTDVTVDYTDRSAPCTMPITITTPSTGTKQINIPQSSNAFGAKYVQTSEPTGSSVCDGDVWYDTTPSGSSGDVGGNVPVGGIIMYSGTQTELNALTNWKLCDGNNGTPNLKDKFVIGADQYSSGWKTNVTGSLTPDGGSKDAVVVQHNHTYVTKGGAYTGDSHTEQSNTWRLESTVNTGDSGESGTNKNLPPYYALAYIMRIS